MARRGLANWPARGRRKGTRLEKVKAYAPASIGNIGPGFDVLGMAIQGMGDIVEVRKRSAMGVRICGVAGTSWRLSSDPDKNTAGIAAARTLEMIGCEEGVELFLHKQIPPASGLGSSAASAVAAAYATNFLYGCPLDNYQLIHAATVAEACVSGGFFADNTATSLLGGATLTRSTSPLEVVPLGTIPEAWIVLVRPELEVLTRKARSILPRRIPLEGFVANLANSCAIVAAFLRQDLDLLSRSIDDRVIEPLRSKLIPGFLEAKEAAMGKGAKGVSLSGAGPSLFSITDDPNKARAIGEAMVNAFHKKGMKASFFLTQMEPQGARLLPLEENRA
jgi:homoserine kinase